MIRLIDVSKRFRIPSSMVLALRDANLAIDSGDSLLITGPSGSGKSTLLNIIGLLDTPSSGNVLLDDRDTTTLSDRDRSVLRNQAIGFVFQRYNMIPELPAWKNVALPGCYGGIARRERKRRALHLMESLGLQDRSQHLPAQLSGGEEQRLAIARAIFMNPQVLLADEPTGNLDSVMGRKVCADLVELTRLGTAVVIVSHDQSLSQHVCRQATLLDGLLSTSIVVD